MTVKRFKVKTFSQFLSDKTTNKEYIKIIINAKNKELKSAILKYSESENKPVNVIIAEALEKMINSKDYKISILRGYDESVDSGINTRENIVSRQFSLDFAPGIINQVDKTIDHIKDAKPKNKITRSLFTQEAIKRYLEPELIRLNYLPASVFKDKIVAANNLKALREKLGLKPQEFLLKYFTPDGVAIISYPQYLVIERTGAGNVDRLIDFLSNALHLEKERFYNSPLEFSEHIKNL